MAHEQSATAAVTPAAVVPELVEWVASSGVRPIDMYHVAAMLEMNGWTDRRAVESGYEHVFALAAAVYQTVDTRFYHETAAVNEKVSLLRSTINTLRLYFAGLAFAMPMLLSSGSVLIVQYSFMSYVGFSVQIATAIALGTFASFVVAGGFSQAIARRGMFYISQNLHSLGRRSSLQLLLIGGIATVVIGLAMNLFSALVPILPWSMVRVASLYYFLLTPIWLGCALLYMTSRTPIINVIFALGIGVVYVAVEYREVVMMTAHVYGMAFVAVGTIVAGLLAASRLERKEDTVHSHSYVMPRWSQIARSLTPFFLYGTLYFVLLFADRMLAWSVPGAFHPFPIWFLGDYELGLDWALWTLVLPMGLVEVYINVMFYRLGRRQKLYRIDNIAGFNRQFRRDHYLFSGAIFLGGLLSIFLIVLVMNSLYQTGVLPFHPLHHPVTRLVFFLAAPAYSVVTVGLQSCLILFSFNEPWPAVRAVSKALVADLVFGFLASRYFGSEWAVLGLITGTLVFAVLASREANKLLGNLDFHLLRTI